MNFRIRKPVLLFWLVLAAVLALGLSACNDSGSEEGEIAEVGGGSEGGGSGSGSLPDACSLLTAEDIAAVLGQDSNPVGSLSEDGLFSTCAWIGVETGASINLNIWSSGTADDDWAQTFINSQSGAEDTEPVSSPSGALLAERDDFLGLYWAIGNDRAVVLTASRTDASQDDIIDLGEKVDGGF
jgi:hypothetical protein